MYRVEIRDSETNQLLKVLGVYSTEEKAVEAGELYFRLAGNSEYEEYQIKKEK